MNLPLEPSEPLGSERPRGIIEFISNLMNFAQTGAMVELFVLDSVEKQADRVIANESRVLKHMKNDPICGESWVAAAKEIKAAFEARRKD